MPTDAEIVAVAAAFFCYPDGLHPTIRGKADIVAFGRALLADSEGKAALQSNPPVVITDPAAIAATFERDFAVEDVGTTC